MADRYLKATGNWNNNNTWSATDGGAAGASFPTAGDNAYITANGNGLTLTVNVNSTCEDFICSGATTATVAGASNIIVNGSITLLSSMTWTKTGQIQLRGTAARSITTNGLSTTSCTHWNLETSSGTMTVQDELTCSIVFYAGGVFDLNGQTIN